MQQLQPVLCIIDPFKPWSATDSAPGGIVQMEETASWRCAAGNNIANSWSREQGRCHRRP